MRDSGLPYCALLGTIILRSTRGTNWEHTVATCALWCALVPQKYGNPAPALKFEINFLFLQIDNLKIIQLSFIFINFYFNSKKLLF